jgi:hypothetical protein
MNKSNNDSYNFPNLNVYLNDEEVDQLKSLNKTSNLSQKSINDKKDPLNISIKNLFTIWAKMNVDIFTDLVVFFSTLGKYSKFFDDVDNTTQWYNGIRLILSELIKIFTKDQRVIYFGFTLIVLSFMLYLIGISS